jgi:DNA helicase HerA-like ATPase
VFWGVARYRKIPFNRLSRYAQTMRKWTGFGDGDPALEYIRELLEDVDTFNPPGGRAVHPGTRGAIRRDLRIVMARLDRMERSNARMRQTLEGFPFDALPNPKAQPEELVRPGRISIMYLGGYDHITQCSIVALTLETLFEHRANLSDRIPPFQIIVEEAHTFIPSAREGTADAVSLPVLRRMITEGRKFGTGLLLISQRPNRLDETVVSQCNSYLILRLVNPRDQRFVRDIIKNLTAADSKMIPGFGSGQGIVSGQVVRFPLAIHVHWDTDLKDAEIADEDFLTRAREWKPDSSARARAASRSRLENVSKAVAQRRAARGGR